MKCPSCQTENPDDNLFCRKCGAEILLEDTFCGKCGEKFGEEKAEIPLDYSEPQSYTPKHLTDKILDNRSAIEGERKLVTVFFADVAVTINFRKLKKLPV